MPHPAYENPPLLEAVCEMKFVDGEAWDSTVPGLFYEKLSDQFPEKQTKKNVDVSPVQEGNRAGVQHQVQERTIFHNEDETTFIQLAPQFLVINKLDYQSWDHFKSVITEAFEAYREIQEPTSFRSLNLRYINKFDLKAEAVDISGHFNIFPQTEDALSDSFSSFITGVQYSKEDARDTLRIELKPQSDEETRWLLLDINYDLENTDQVDVSDLDSWLETAHHHVWEAFQASITEKTESSFGGKK